MDFLHDISWVVPLRSGPATVLAEAITTFGYTGVALAFVPVGYWLIDRSLFVKLALLVILSAVVNGYLKDLFQDPRPPAYLALDHSEAGSYGLPSGHTQLTTVLWGWFALTFRRRWLWIAGGTAVVLMAMSRLYLGVHDFEDVLGGFLVGVGLLTVAGTFAAFGAGPAQRLHPLVQIAAIAAAEVAVYLAWPHAMTPGTRFAIGGLPIGLWGGVLAERRWVRFQRHPQRLRALGAAVLGMSVVAAAYIPLGWGLETVGFSPVAARWGQLFVTGLFVGWVAPWAFVRTGLAVREPPPGSG